jgi:hypothetical protein
MDAAAERSQFLTSRRAKVTAEQTGLPTCGQRRVPGLPRDEVASLAGLRLAVFTAEPGSRSEEGLELLASWAATAGQISDEHPIAGDARRP